MIQGGGVSWGEQEPLRGGVATAASRHKVCPSRQALAAARMAFVAKFAFYVQSFQVFVCCLLTVEAIRTASSRRVIQSERRRGRSGEEC